MRTRFLGPTLALAAVACAQMAMAQTRQPSISIGKITTQQSCKLYQESSGRSAMVATPYSIAVAESWRTWLVRDCEDNFATMRASLQAALASSGKFVIRTQGGSYSLIAAVSQVSGDPGPAPTAPSAGDGFSISSRNIFVSMEVNLRDSAGHIVYGGLVTKHLETGSSIRTGGGLQTSSSQSGEAVYTELQNQVALAVARVVAFHIVPLKVISAEDREIRLNYGSPLLALGTIVQATSPDGGAMVRYNVTSSDPNGAIAEIDQEGGGARIVPGSVAYVIEDDDLSANRRRSKRVELPE